MADIKFIVLNLLLGRSLNLTLEKQYNKIIGCAKMKRIMNFINDVDMDDRTQSILRGELVENAVYEKVLEFNALHIDHKQLYLIRLGQRISSLTKPHQLLTTLLLIDHISKCNPRLSVPRAISNLQQGSTKESIILINAIRYYHYFLQCNMLNRFNLETVNPEDQFKQVQDFCMVSIRKIKEFFKIGFVYEQGILRLPEHKFLLQSVARSILQRFSQDLQIISLFVKNNLEMILQKTIKHPSIFLVNHIYEQLLKINHELPKLESLARLVRLKVEFARYEVDMELNREIEAIMGQRKKEKEAAMSEYQQSEKEFVHDCYLSSEREILTTESFLIAQQGMF